MLKKKKNLVKKIVRRLEQTFIQERDRWPKSTWKKCSISVIIREIWLKTTMRYHLTPVRIAINKKSTSGVLLWCSGLRIWCCHCSGFSGCCGMGLTPGPGSSTWPKKKKSLQAINAGEDIEKRDPSCTADGNVTWCNHCGAQYGGSLNISGENHNLKRYSICIPVFIAALFIIVKTWK